MDSSSLLARAVDATLDRSVVLGYTSIGSGVRRKFWPADPAPGSLVGKRVLVTGATSGIGEAMARSFLDLGATVHLLGRNPDKVADYARDLRLEVPNADIVEEVCDLSDLDAVRAFSTDLAGRVDALHGLVHNAGVMPPERVESAQGHEMALAAHVLGPHLMTHLLRERLTAGPGSVVWMSSGGMYGSGLRTRDDADIEYRRGEYKGVQAYARTKRMQVVLADAWATELAGTGVKVESMHPGWVRTPGVTESLPTFNKVLGKVLREPEDGADTAVWLVATRPTSEHQHFWHDRAQRPTTFGWQRQQDPDLRARLLEYVATVTATPRLR
ncbi:Fatty acyl-CoA reductase [Nocardioides dokdonensis FR1436]|uniref:Fatty acyl-CoA reductase n=1 Tax=Nocardioides dokdonensis FR1436 TaxID=1300347 RepID=A0A1A9GJH4_9ACTN|nr:SDR family NAD(P)-dependent oxidoreductase [Nocardioides dokdonensis]ANH37763.1 Fatty acyl-CoA reductase [Nocardioides dokdonensis FR1436]